MEIGDHGKRGKTVQWRVVRDTMFESGNVMTLLQWMEVNHAMASLHNKENAMKEIVRQVKEYESFLVLGLINLYWNTDYNMLLS